MILYQVLGAFLAISAFAIILETPKKYVIYAGVVGAIGWFVYLITNAVFVNEVFATFLSTIGIAFVSQTFARIFKVPVTVFLIAGILPTVPGAGMYRIVYYFILSDMEMTAHYLVLTLEIAGAIAVGLFIVDAIFRMFQKNIDKSLKIV